MIEIAPGWSMDIERGPDWLIVRLRCADVDSPELPSLGEMLWSLLNQHLTNRLVVECDELPQMPRSLVGQLDALQERIHAAGGVLRLSGLTELHRETLRICQAERRFPHFRTRSEAVLGRMASKPR